MVVVSVEAMLIIVSSVIILPLEMEAVLIMKMVMICII